MQLGMIGLGRMGANIVRRLMQHGHACVVHDRDPEPGRQLAAEGAIATASFAQLAGALAAPRTVWVMLPAGEATEAAIAELSGLLDPGDTIIDGGNTFWKDDVRRARELKQKGVHYLDVGTSGGVWGLERGYCLMIGGEKAVVDRLDPIFAALAPGKGGIPATPARKGRDPRAERGYLHAGPNGAGHFVKMIHNGIEYGMMQAMAEGFDILKNAGSPSLPEELRLAIDVADVAEVWRRGSVITSWLLDLTAAALAEDPELAGFSGHVGDSGEGRWTVQAAIEEAVPAEVLTSALYARFRSRQDHTFAEKVLSAMRKGFGGHVEFEAVMTEGKPAVIVLMGVSGCGKSTIGGELSRMLGWPFRDADSFHPPANIEKMRQAIALTDDDRWPWLDAIGSWIGERLARREPGIVSCSALKRAYRTRIGARRQGVRLVYLLGSQEMIAGRLAARAGHFMPAELLASQFAALEEPGPEERALVVGIAMPPLYMARSIVEKFGLTGAGGSA